MTTVTIEDGFKVALPEAARKFFAKATVLVAHAMTDIL